MPTGPKDHGIYLLTVLKFYPDSGYVGLRKVIGWAQSMSEAEEILSLKNWSAYYAYDHVVTEAIQRGLCQSPYETRWYKIMGATLSKIETPRSAPDRVGMG